MDTNDKRINIAKAMQLLFIEANKFVYYTYTLKIFFFIINILIIIFSPTETPLFIWSVLGVNIIVILVSLFLDKISRNYYELAEKLRKIDMIKKIFPNANDKAEESYIKSKLPSKILKEAEDNSQYQTEYYSDQTTKFSRLIENIQENCYWTSSLMRIYSKKIKIVLYIIIIVFLISVIIGFNLLSTDNSQENIKHISRFLAFFINFIFALNIYSHQESFEKKSAMLKNIDNNLESKKVSPSEDEVIKFFTEYNCILTDALPYPKWVYDANEENLNTVWKDRVDND